MSFSGKHFESTDRNFQPSSRKFAFQAKDFEHDPTTSSLNKFYGNESPISALPCQFYRFIILLFRDEVLIGGNHQVKVSLKSETLLINAIDVITVTSRLIKCFAHPIGVIIN